MWLLVGVGLTLFLVADPIGVSPVDEWMGIHHESTGGNPASPEGFAGTSPQSEIRNLESGLGLGLDLGVGGGN
jgi:hypothetical protein